MSNDQKIKAPAPRPCGSCPYRLDTPSGVWSADEYDKLPEFDGQTWEQPTQVFMCHQQDGCLCAGWVAVHDMDENLGLRFAVAGGDISPEVAEQVRDYTTDVPLFATGAEAAEFGKREIEQPPAEAVRMVQKLHRKKGQKGG